MLAPISWRTPPRHYGPWELVTSLLTEALVARGVDVTLFATKDSLTAGKLSGVCPAPYSEDPSIDAKAWEMLHVAHVFERAGEFDLIHNQGDFVPLAFSRLVETPVVTTIHGFSSERILPAFKAYEHRVHYVAISDADRRSDLRYAATIHHGIRMEDFVFDAHGSDDLLFFGRIHPDKGPAEAIAAARRSGRRLVMAGIVQDRGLSQRASRARSQRRPRGLSRLRGWGGPRQGPGFRARFAPPHQLRRSRSDYRWWRRSPAVRPSSRPTADRCPSLIDHGVTGFLVNSVDEAVEAIGRIGGIDRAACRAAVFRALHGRPHGRSIPGAVPLACWVRMVRPCRYLSLMR